MLMNFKNICRTCLCNEHLQSIENNGVIIEILQIITDYKNDDELPKNICDVCVLKINEIRSFVLQCKTNDATLKNHLNDVNIDGQTIKKEIIVNSAQDEEVAVAGDYEQDATSLDGVSVSSGGDADEKNSPVFCYKCDMCTLEFTDLRQFTRHKKMHPNTGRKTPKKYNGNKYVGHKCDECDMVYTSAEHLAQHKRVHHKINAKYKCEICAKEFVSLSGWTRHRVLHGNEHSIRCDVCGKTFNYLYNLKVHRRVHTGTKPYKCGECDRCFTNSTQLKRHRQLHTDEKPYFCEICSKAFTEPGQLKQHKRTHSGEKPYFCQLCEKGFSFANSLIRHNRTHTGEKPYKCKICMKKFTDSSNLARHIKIHL